MTIKNQDKKERIIGFGSKELMNIVYQKKLNYQRFLESDYMKNKKFYQAIKKNLNNNDFYMYIINENKEIKRNISYNTKYRRQ
jgi:hypothetical protein